MRNEMNESEQHEKFSLWYCNKMSELIPNKAPV